MNKSLATLDCAAYARPKVAFICHSKHLFSRGLGGAALSSDLASAAGTRPWNIHDRGRKENTEVSSQRWVIDDPPSGLSSCYHSSLLLFSSTSPYYMTLPGSYICDYIHRVCTQNAADPYSPTAVDRSTGWALYLHTGGYIGAQYFKAYAWTAWWYTSLTQRIAALMRQEV